MRRQFAERQPDRPYSNGALETVFDAITKRLWTRRFVFRNRARLQLALRLMLLDLEGSADELRYREVIRKALLAGGGQPPKARRSLDDRGGSSIHAEVRAVIARTAAKRAQNARHAKASYNRKKAARFSRTSRGRPGAYELLGTRSRRKATAPATAPATSARPQGRLRGDDSLAVEVSGVPTTVKVASAAHSVCPRTSARARQVPASPARVRIA